jgi:hypothetical protein
MRIAYIANGELWLQEGSAPARQVESRFANEARSRSAKSAQVNSWKHAERDEQRGVIPNSMLWRQRGNTEPLAPPRFDWVIAGPDADTIYYALTIGRSCGLFEYHIRENREVRILHGADFRCQGLCFDAATGHLLISREGADGRSHLQLIDTNGNPRGQLTGGDCLDCSPSLVPGDPDAIYFQSTGLALHPTHGHVVAMANAVINRLDRKSRDVTPVAEHADRDLLAPRMDARGNLYYIRRPYARPHQATAFDTAKDIVLFPWRLLKAIFGYLNFFSMIYGKEPLKSAGGPRGPGLDQDLGSLWLHGRMIELSKVRYEAGKGGGLVPGSWQLMRRGSDGIETQLAGSVASFDVDGDGAVVYTNGFEIRTFPSPTSQPIGRGELIQCVVAIR